MKQIPYNRSKKRPPSCGISEKKREVFTSNAAGASVARTIRRSDARISSRTRFGFCMMDKYEALSRYYGHESFRPGQEALVDALTGGRDAFGVMPTGGGKSVCYQIPALLSDGITLVISPLVSLMADQVATLKQMGVAAAYLNATLTPRQMELACERMARGAYKIVYAAPERLNVPSFAALCRKLPIRIVAVDEAHCVSQWGQDFRPSYLAIADFIALFPKRPAVGAFTATATELVRSDIERLLCLKDPVRVVTGFDRPNLFYEVKTPKDKLDALLHFAAAHEEQSGIVYCSTRKTVEQVHAELVHYGFSAARYHAGLSDDERAKAQEDFRFDRVRLIVATNAFGMGIDKSNVSYVLHYNMPQSPEAYYQEAGRAGRDGENAQCVLYFSTRDVVTARWLIRHRAPNEALTAEQAAALQKQDEVRLQKMVDYCETSACLRGALLDYFGQKHPLRCNACANCKRARETAAFLLRPLPAPAPAPVFGMRDVSREAAAFLAGISKMGSGVRCAFAVKMLQKNAQVGTALYEKSDEFLRALAAQLVQSGFVSENEFGGKSAELVFADEAALHELRGQCAKKFVAFLIERRADLRIFLQHFDGERASYAASHFGNPRQKRRRLARDVAHAEYGRGRGGGKRAQEKRRGLPRPFAVGAGVAAQRVLLPEIIQQSAAKACRRFAIVDHFLQANFVLFLQRRGLLGRQRLVRRAMPNEPARRDDVPRAKIQHALRIFAVAPRAPRLLIIRLGALRHVVMKNVGNVGFVDPHAEGVRRHDEAHAVESEVLLRLCALVVGQPRVITCRRKAVMHKFGVNLLDRLSRGTVDDAALLFVRGGEMQQRVELVLRRFDFVKKIRPVEPRDHAHGILQAQQPLDVASHELGRRRGERAHGGTLRKKRDEIRDRKIARAKVLPPLGDAVRLVHGDDADRQFSAKRGERRHIQTLRCGVDDLVRPARHAFAGKLHLARRQRGVQIRRRDAHLLQRRDLIGHERDERAYDQGDPVRKQRGDLIAHGLAAARRHHAERVASARQRVDKRLLPGAERLVSVIARKRFVFIHHAKAETRSGRNPRIRAADRPGDGMRLPRST